MRYALLPAALAGLLLAGIAAGALLVPGIVAQPTDDKQPDPRPPSKLDVVETTVDAGPVTGSRATLTVGTYLAHRGRPAENVSVLYRAVDPASDLVVDRDRRTLGNVSGTEERVVNGSLTVAREGEYRLETIIYENGTRTRSTRTRLSGVGSLRPDYARADVRFHRFTEVGLPVVQYSIADAGNRTTLNVSTFLTNGGGDRAEDLRVTVYARQVDSNIVADRATMRVDAIGAGETVTPDAELEVPDEYNYHLEAVLWKQAVIVDTARSGAALAPRERVPENTTTRERDIEVGDFEESTPEPSPTPAPSDGADGGDGAGDGDGDGPGGGDAGAASPAEATEAGGQPGFGVAVAAVALLAAALLGRRWSA